MGAFSLDVLTVSQLNRHVRACLEYELGEVRVVGELSNVTKPTSGHVYFTLKDVGAQIRCVYFRNRRVSGDADVLQTGQRVLAVGTLSLYEARGDYQLIVTQLNDAGLGDLHQQFERLKQTLLALGLFDAARKKTLPQFPQRIGVVTSSSGAALQDILTTLARRFPLIPIRLYASDVQGKQAPKQLIAALQQARLEALCDVLILARGGGSMEDLWAFNDEQLAYAMAACEIPIITGIGHETDVTIADFVADVRAATPTAAAETVVPNWLDVMTSIAQKQAALVAAMSRMVQQKRALFRVSTQIMASPVRLVRSHWQTLDYLQRQLHRGFQQSIAQKRHQWSAISARLQACHPAVSHRELRWCVRQLEKRLIQAMLAKHAAHQTRFITQLATLHAVSPLATLDRGYALATHNDRVLMDSRCAQVGDLIAIRLAKGRLMCEVIERYTAGGHLLRF